MAEKKKIKITNPELNGRDEGATMPANDYDDEIDDERDQREPIDLDASVELSDAIAAASRPRKAAPTDAPIIEDALQSEATSGPDLVINTPNSAATAREIETLKTQAAQANENYLRALADLQNFRRRGEEERARILREGNEKLIKELLPVLDDFDLAVNAAKQAQSYEQLIGGVEAILRKFHETLSKQGVAAIEAVGSPFDPDVHEAVMLDEESDQPDETVTAELRKGYLMNGRVIRPALVKVAKSA